MGASNRYKSWIRRKDRIRKKVFGKTDRPRLTVFRSSKHIYCQLIDDNENKTVLSASSSENIFAEKSEEIKEAAEGHLLCMGVGFRYPSTLRSRVYGV